MSATSGGLAFFLLVDDFFLEVRSVVETVISGLSVLVSEAVVAEAFFVPEPAVSALFEDLLLLLSLLVDFLLEELFESMVRVVVFELLLAVAPGGLKKAERSPDGTRFSDS